MNEEPQRDSDAEPAAPSANETGTPSEPGRSPRANGPARPRERASGSCAIPCSPERNSAMRRISTLVGR